MQTLKCEMCGSNEIVKQEDLFVCQICGTKYSVEAARKMMGVVAIDKSGEADNLYARAEQFFNEGNLREAEKYIPRILDIDANHASALALKDGIENTIRNNETKSFIKSKIGNGLRSPSTQELEYLLDIKNKVKDFPELQEQFNQVWSELLGIMSKNFDSKITNYQHLWQMVLLHTAIDSLPEDLLSIQNKLAKEYFELVEKGEVQFGTSKAVAGYAYSNLYLNIYNQLELPAHLIVESPGHKAHRKGLEYATRLNKIPSIWLFKHLDLRSRMNYEHYSRIELAFGRTIQYHDGDESVLIKILDFSINDTSIQAIENHFASKLARLNEIDATTKQRKSKGQCIFCGKATADQYCKNCGMPDLIDYNKHSNKWQTECLPELVDILDSGGCKKCGKKLTIFGSCKNKSCSKARRISL